MNSALRSYFHYCNCSFRWEASLQFCAAKTDSGGSYSWCLTVHPSALRVRPVPGQCGHHRRESH